MEKTLIFEYTNAYDVNSGDELNQLFNNGIITDFKMKSDGCKVWAKELEPVINIMKKYDFIYRVINNA